MDSPVGLNRQNKVWIQWQNFIQPYILSKILLIFSCVCPPAGYGLTYITVLEVNTAPIEAHLISRVPGALMSVLENWGDPISPVILLELQEKEFCKTTSWAIWWPLLVLGIMGSVKDDDCKVSAFCHNKLFKTGLNLARFNQMSK